MAAVIRDLEAAQSGGRNTALNAVAWTLGRWIAAALIEQHEVEDGLFAVAERNGLVADDG